MRKAPGRALHKIIPDRRKAQCTAEFMPICVSSWISISGIFHNRVRSEDESAAEALHQRGSGLYVNFRMALETLCSRTFCELGVDDSANGACPEEKRE